MIICFLEVRRTLEISVYKISLRTLPQLIDLTKKENNTWWTQLVNTSLKFCGLTTDEVSFIYEPPLGHLIFCLTELNKMKLLDDKSDRFEVDKRLFLGYQADRGKMFSPYGRVGGIPIQPKSYQFQTILE